MNAAAAAEEASAGPTYELTQSAAQTIVAETFAITEEIFNDIRGILLNCHRFPTRKLLRLTESLQN